MQALSASDLRLLRAFELCQLAPADLHHREHLRLAYIYLVIASFDDALKKLRAGLKHFLSFHGAPASAYHETITQAWLLAVRHFMDSAGPTKSSEDFLARSPRLLERAIMATHYTPEALTSPAARERFLEPDRMSISRPSPERPGH